MGTAIIANYIVDLRKSNPLIARFSTKWVSVWSKNQNGSRDGIKKRPDGGNVIEACPLTGIPMGNMTV